MKEISPRAKRVMSLQRKAFILNAFLSTGIAWLILQAFGIVDFLPTFFLGIIIIHFSLRALNFLSLVLIQFHVYGGDIDALKKDADEALEILNGNEKAPHVVPPRSVMLKIVQRPEKVLGRYKDAEFFEWIDVQDEDGIVKRFIFDGAIDMENGFSVPEGSILLPPGILYSYKNQVDTK